MADNKILYDIQADTKDIKKKLKGIEDNADKTGDKVGKSLSKGFAAVGIAAAAAGAAVIYFAAQALRQGIEAAQIQENAINRMNAALQSAGTFSQAASKDMQDFASSLQKTSTIGDETTLSYLALASSFTKTNEQTKELVTAAVDMAAQMGTSVDAAIMNLGGTLSGMIGLLGKSVGSVKGLTQEQLKAGDAIKLVADRFQGAAAAAATTYQGRMIQLTNAWGDFLEEIGFFVVKSKTMIGLMDFMKKEVVKLGGALTEFRDSNGDAFKPLMLGAINVAGFVTSILGPALEAIVGVAKTVVTWFGNIAKAALSLWSGDFSGAAENIKAAFTETADVVVETFGFAGTRATNAFLNRARENILTNSLMVKEPLAEIANDKKGLVDQTVKEAQAVDLLSLAYINLGERSKKYAKHQESVSKATIDLKKTLLGTFVNGFQSAFASMGKAMVEGGNMFSAFGKMILGMFGQLAMQLGQYYLLLGLATVWTNPAAGAGMIAGGIALSVLGGALQALGGGGQSGGSATASSGSASASSGTTSPLDSELVDVADTEDAKPQTNIVVNVDGNIYGDKKQFGKEMVEILNESFELDGVRLVNGIAS